MPSDQLLRDVFHWDVRSWSRALPLWQEHLAHATGKNALAIGERDGGSSLWLAQQGFDVLCTDLNGPSEQARTLHARYGVSERVSYGAQDVTALQLPNDHFDVVIFKSVIGALSTKERQQIAIDEIRRVLKPGGVLLFAENLTGTALHRLLRKRFIKWDTYWRYLSLPDDLDLFRDLEHLQTGSTGFLANLGRSEGQRDLLARFDGLVMPLVPASWRYLLFGAARKS